MKKILLIEAISSSAGGSLVHLKNILNNFEKQNFFNEIDVLIPKQSIKFMPKKKNINYIYNTFLEQNLVLRIIWQVLYLNIFIRFKNYNCIFVTGSSHFLLSKNVVTISQNLLPFTESEVKKYFFSPFYLKLKLLKITQIISFKLSKGIIFLHKYSKNEILKFVKSTKAKIEVIAHSVDLKKKSINKLNHKKFRLIYISNIDYYKNQDFIIETLTDLFKKKPVLSDRIYVEFYGNYYRPALKKMNKKISLLGENKKNFRYFGLLPREKIYKYKKGFTTISLFSSSCENFSVSLIESMAIGVPILCVNLQPMKSVLGNSAFYYKHMSKKSFQNQVLNIIKKNKSYSQKVKTALIKSKKYNTISMAIKTFNFLKKMSN